MRATAFHPIPPQTVAFAERPPHGPPTHTTHTNTPDTPQAAPAHRPHVRRVLAPSRFTTATCSLLPPQRLRLRLRPRLRLRLRLSLLLLPLLLPLLPLRL